MKFIDFSSKQEEYKAAQPFPHVHIENVLDSNTHQQLVEALQQEQFFEKEADLFHFLQTNDLKGSENPIIQELIKTITSEDVLSQIETMSSAKLKRGVLDVQGSIYADTHFLLCHDDQLDDRKLAFIYYLNDMDKEEGGGLRLYYSAGGKVLADKFVTMQPKANSIVIFTVSERSYHEVEEVLVDKPRMAIGGWFHGSN